jgi:hypothetical protein
MKNEGQPVAAQYIRGKTVQTLVTAVSTHNRNRRYVDFRQATFDPPHKAHQDFCTERDADYKPPLGGH